MSILCHFWLFLLSTVPIFASFAGHTPSMQTLFRALVENIFVSFVLIYNIMQLCGEIF